MAEGLSPSEVGKEIGEHRKHGTHAAERHGATVLFLVGINSHFALRQARYGLVAVGTLILAFSVIQLLGLPGPPA